MAELVGGENMQLKRYELRLYSNTSPFQHLLSYVPFETEQQAQDYFNENMEDMDNDWKLYLVTLTPNNDHVEFIRNMKPTIKKENLRFIGHMRGISQYEVINRSDMRLALVLACNDKFYLSFAECEEKYNLNIDVRIHNAYDHTKVGLNTNALGREVTICE